MELFARSTSALFLSILVIATTYGILASVIAASASRVWGITPSSAATTKMAMSAARAPRAAAALAQKAPVGAIRSGPQKGRLRRPGKDGHPGGHDVRSAPLIGR